MISWWIILVKGEGLMMSANVKMLDNLICSIADGDNQALAQLYHETSGSIYAFALSFLKNSHDAQDVLHDCYLSIYSAAADYRSDGKPMAWILTIAKNLCLKILRQRKRTADLPLEDWRNYVDTCVEMTADDKVVLRQCMEHLSDEERQIVVLHAVSGFKHREIAELMNLALPTVLSKYHRAIKKLKTYL